MISFLVRRFLWMIVTLWVVFTVTFLLMRAVPGGPFSQERKVDRDVKRNLERRYKLDQPLYRQYAVSLWDTVWHWDLGPSMKLKDYTVNEIIAQGFPVSASLGGWG